VQATAVTFASPLCLTPGKEKKHSPFAKLTDWTATVDKVLVF